MKNEILELLLVRPMTKDQIIIAANCSEFLVMPAIRDLLADEEITWKPGGTGSIYCTPEKDDV